MIIIKIRITKGAMSLIKKTNPMYVGVWVQRNISYRFTHIPILGNQFSAEASLFMSDLDKGRIKCKFIEYEVDGITVFVMRNIVLNKHDEIVIYRKSIFSNKLGVRGIDLNFYENLKYKKYS